MPKEEEVEDEIDDEEDDEEVDDEDEEDDLDEREYLLESIVGLLDDSLEDCESASLVEGEHIELVMSDDTKWRLSLKQIT